jgi:hypothetical protein
MTDKPIIYIDGVRAEPELQAVAWRPVVEDQRLYLVHDGPDDTRYYIESYSAEGDTAWFSVRSPGVNPE